MEPCLVIKFGMRNAFASFLKKLSGFPKYDKKTFFDLVLFILLEFCKSLGNRLACEKITV